MTCPHHTEWDSDYRLQIKWVMKVIAGKAEFANAPNWIVFLKMHAWDGEGSGKIKISRGESIKKKHGALMSHKEGIRGAVENRGEKNNEQFLRREEGETECKGGRKLLLEQLVTAETTRTPLPSSRANWLCSIFSLFRTHTLMIWWWTYK